MAANMWKNSLKNVEYDNKEVYTKPYLDFFLQRNGTYFLNKPRSLPTSWKISCTLLNWRVHFFVRSILNQVNPIYTLPSYFLNVCLSVIFSSVFMSSQWCLSYRVPYRNLMCIFLSHTCHILSLAWICILYVHIKNLLLNEPSLVFIFLKNKFSHQCVT